MDKGKELPGFFSRQEITSIKLGGGRNIRKIRHFSIAAPEEGENGEQGREGDEDFECVSMEKGVISKLLKDFFEEEFPNQGMDLEYTTDLLNDWFVDSLGIINTVLFLEREFAISIARADINSDNFQNIDTLSTFVRKTLG